MWIRYLCTLPLAIHGLHCIRLWQPTSHARSLYLFVTTKPAHIHLLSLFVATTPAHSHTHRLCLFCNNHARCVCLIVTPTRANIFMCCFCYKLVRTDTLCNNIYHAILAICSGFLCYFNTRSLDIYTHQCMLI